MIKETLSEREAEVLELFSKGDTAKEIAAKIFLSPHTVRDHIKSFIEKLGAKNGREAVYLHYIKPIYQ